VSDFYEKTGAPSNSTLAASSTIRGEFSLIEEAMDKLPTLNAKGDEIVKVNAGGTALETTPLSTLIPISTVQIFTANGTYTPTAGARAAKVTAVGAGASGAGTGTSGPISTDGGAAGGVVVATLSLSGGGTATIQVGVGGTGTNGASDDGTGSQFAGFSVTLIATFGQSGGSTAPTGGDLHLSSAGGGLGTSNGIPAFGGKGEDTPLGFGNGDPSTTGTTGPNGVGYGAGGSGGFTSGATDVTGGDGADGIVIVEEFY
jgi:hypothetical protein